MDIWPAVQSLGALAAVAVAAWAAFQARAAARESNTAAVTLANIESQRRRNELCPRLRVTCEPWNPGSDIVRLRVMLIGPSGLDRIDRLSVAIRNDHFRRGEGEPVHTGGPTPEEIKQHIWGPYRFRPGTGPDEARADPTGRETVYDEALPLGEELPYVLEHTTPGHWITGMTQPSWLQQRGTVVRLAVTAEHDEYGTWYLPCEIDTATLPATVYVPQSGGPIG
jgi:hypothetical protein